LTAGPIIKMVDGRMAGHSMKPCCSPAALVKSSDPASSECMKKICSQLARIGEVTAWGDIELSQPMHMGAGR